MPYVPSERLYLGPEGQVVTQTEVDEGAIPVSLLCGADCEMDDRTAIYHGLMEAPATTKQPEISPFARALEGGRDDSRFDNLKAQLKAGEHPVSGLSSLEWAFMCGLDYALHADADEELKLSEEEATVPPASTPDPVAVDGDTHVDETDLDDATKERLETAGLDTLSKIRAATDEQILSIKGIGLGTLEAIRAL